MEELQKMIDEVAMRTIQFRQPPSMIAVNQKMYNLIQEQCQVMDTDYDDIKIQTCGSVMLVIDDTVPDGKFECR